MANEFNFMEKNVKLQEWWEEDNPQLPGIVETLLIQGYKDKIETAVDVVRWDDYNIPDLCRNIGFYFASMGKSAPIETVIGGIASIIKVSREKDPVTVAKNLTTAGEMVFMLAPHICEISPTYNGRLVVRSKVYTTALADPYLYPLPGNKPTRYHKTLGKYKWNLTETTALDKLNKLKFTVLDFEEHKPAKKKKNEQYEKWLVRKHLRKDLSQKVLYFDWHSDYRGRMYAGGYHINPQGSEYEKSIVTFADPEKLTIRGYNELYKSIATAFGQGKQLDGNKLQWYYDHENDLDWRVAKEPETARKLLYALEQANKTGGYTNVPIELDGTNSQLQVVSVLTGSKATAETCNVIPGKGDKIADAYGLLADMMTNVAAIRGIK